MLNNGELGDLNNSPYYTQEGKCKILQEICAASVHKQEMHTKL
jgi:hypothetical protein